jgi:hypothetical protein
MSSSSDKSGSKSLLSVQMIVLAGIAWALLALVFFLLGGVAPPGQEYPVWYQVGTTVFELVAYLLAGLLCFRNWRSPQIVSGRNVWLALGLGMFCYFIGGLLFFYWESVLGQEADVSPGDFFYVLTYIFLCWGMISAVLSRRLNLEIWQYGVVAGIATAGFVLGFLISATPATPEAPASFLMPPAVAQAPPTQQKPAQPKATPKPGAAKPTPAKPGAKANPIVKPAAAPKVQPKASPAPAASPAPVAEPAAAEKAPAPAWVTSIEEQLAPLKFYIDWFYLISDIVLLITATTLLMAFWGGRSSLSWRMIAAAAFSLYLADIWFKYATTRLPNYKSGSPPEVFWIFSGVLFGIGAALEHDLSMRSQRSGRRRRGA